MRNNIIMTGLGLLVALGAGCGQGDDKDTTPKDGDKSVENTRKAAAKAIGDALKGRTAKGSDTKTMPPATTGGKEPDRIKVRHILISFRGRGTKATRSKEEAEALAQEIYNRALAGEDFPGLMREYSDDSGPGIYGMTNKGVSRVRGYYPRTGMVPAFGDVGFKLGLNEIGLAPFDETKSKFGWHIIQRIE